MQPPLRDIGIPNAIIMVLLVFLLTFPSGAVAQDQSTDGGNQPPGILEYLDRDLNTKYGKQSSSLGPVISGVNTNSLDGDYLVFEYDQMWEFTSQVIETEELGDINGDGTEDFVMTFPNQNRVGVYWGRENISNTPDHIIDLEFSPTGVAAGDFDGDGLSDIAISDRYGQNLVIFFGGNSLSSVPDQTIQASDVNPEITNPYFTNVNTIGDVNADGKDDLLLGSLFASNDGVYLNEAYLFYGGDTISDSPVRINLSSDSDMIEAGVTSTGLGDINGDGVDDFAVGITADTTREDHSTGVVLVYHGGKEQVYEKPADTLKPERYVGGFGFDIAGGDFNGNGATDIAVTARNLITELQPYPPVVHIFYGKEDLSSYADTLLNRPLFEDEGLANENSGHLEVVNDFNNDGIDELILTSLYNNQYRNYSNAAFYTFTNNSASPSAFLKAPDTEKGLGGLLNSAVGDFTGNGNIDIVLTQTDPSTESETNPPSDIYRYELVDEMPPAQVQGVEILQRDGKKVLNWQEVGALDLDTYLIFTTDADGQPFEIPVDSTNENRFALPDHFEGVQTFAVAALDLNNNEGKASAPVNVIYPQTVTYKINTGWNLIATVLEDAAGQSELQELMSGPLYLYEGGYQEVDQLQDGQAYWAKFSEADKHEIKGMPVTKKSIELRKGWNLIGGIGGDLPISSIDDPEEIIIPETGYSFDQAYTSVDTLGPARGYWIRASAKGMVTLTHPKLLKQQGKGLGGAEKSLTRATGKITESFNKITISNDKHSSDLYFGHKLPKGIDKRRYSLPPLPPGDVFDVRFDGDKRLAENDRVDILLNKTEEKPVNIRIDTGNGARADKFIIKEFSDSDLLAKHTIYASEEVTLKQKKTDTITLIPVGISEREQEKTPDEFNLEQNYPNPFNPITQIRYSIAEATDVKIDVFNILGRRVTTLVSERQQPGSYEVTFDGSNFASGIYLYRLQAGDYISTKKFILAK